MSINVLLTLVEQYKEAAQLIEAAQAEQEQLKIQIREALAERSTNYLEVGCHKVRLSDFSSTLVMIGSWLIDRESTHDTLKNIMTIPVSMPKWKIKPVAQ